MSPEAVAVGLLLDAFLWLSPETADGVVPPVSDQERLSWKTVAID